MELKHLCLSLSQSVHLNGSLLEARMTDAVQVKLVFQVPVEQLLWPVLPRYWLLFLIIDLIVIKYFWERTFSIKQN